MNTSTSTVTVISNSSEDLSYEQQLKNIGITLLEPFTRAKAPHHMLCDICGHKWSATPTSKLASYKKYGGNGCPNCKELRAQRKNETARIKILEQLTARNITVLTAGYDGNQSSAIYIRVRNNNCGHEFDITPTNLIHNGVNCSICGIEERTHKVNPFYKGGD